MKNTIRKAMMMAMALVLIFTTTALADTIVSPSFNFSGVQERPTAEPTVEPTVAPTAEPVEDPAAEPTVEPVVEPTEEPVPEATAEPQITMQVLSNLNGRSRVMEGTVMVLTLVVEGADGYDYTIRWQQSWDGANWEDIPGANGMEYTLALRPEHSGMSWRACLDITD